MVLKLSPYEFMGNEAAIRKFQAKYAQLFQPGEVVLDIGCGRGIFMELLRHRGVKPIGVDQADEAVNVCREKSFYIQQKDAFLFLAESRDCYDGIFASHFIEHFEPSVVIHFFELCYKALKPGGLLAIATPNTSDLVVMTQWFWQDPTHVRPYPLELVKSLFIQSGLAVEIAGEDRRTLGSRGFRHRLKDEVRRITTLGLAARGDIFVTGRKEKN